MQKILEAIENLGLSANQFSKSIGMDPGGWSRKKRGITKFTEEDLSTIVRAHPELAPAILQDLFGDNWKQITTELFMEIVQEMKVKELRDGNHT
jgi:hypothetical protein